MNQEIKHFNQLTVWQQAHNLVLEIYSLTLQFPQEERFGIIIQLRRASSSITANIAEGCGRYHLKEKTRFYYQARGSLAEVQNFLILSKDLHYIKPERFNELHQQVINIWQLLNGLIRSICERIERGSSP